MIIVEIRTLKESELAEFWQVAYANPDAEWVKWNGPYFHDTLPKKSEFLGEIGKKWADDPFHKVIIINGKIVGSVGAYFADGRLKRWLEVGIIVYAENNWGKHIGREALAQWITYLFKATNLPHIGFTTWSGNERMMHVGQALGMQLEGRIRKVRYWNNQYFDSIKYGVLRDEWLELQLKEEQSDDN